MKHSRTLIILKQKLLQLFLLAFGLLTIIGTGDDDDSGNSYNSPPVAIIDSPSTGMVVPKGNSVTFTGTASDPEEQYLQGNALKWTSTVDGDIGFGASFTRDNLSSGSHTITLTATDNKGVADSSSVDLTVNPYGNTIPQVVISSPTTGTTYDVNNFIEFTGTGSDAEDGWLTGSELVWNSSIDGQIGIGGTVNTNGLSPGTHMITLKATDSANTSGTSSITLMIHNTPPTATIDFPADGGTYSVGQAIVFNGTATDPEEGNLTDLSLVWRTSNHGVIGTGSALSIDYLPVGTDIIVNFSATDSGGLVDTDSIVITIEP